jgi:ammonium transporter Rh
VYSLAALQLSVFVLFGTCTKEAFLAEDSTFANVYEWGIITEGFFKALYHGHWDSIKVDLVTFMDALFFAAAVLISYGGVIGKTSPLQLIVLALLEAIFYSFNKEYWCFGIVDLVDAGGTVNILMFDAFFGLAVAWMLAKPPKDADP